MANLGHVLLTTDQAYADSAWASPLVDTPEQQQLLRVGPGLVLQQEGLVRDLVTVGNRQVRRNLGFKVGDRIVLRLLLSPEMWWAVHYNLDLLATELLVEDIEINQVSTAQALAAGWEQVTVGDKVNPFTVYMTAARADTPRFSQLSVLANLF